MNFTRFIARLIFCAALASLTACGGTDDRKAAAPKSAEDRFPIKVGDRTVLMQLAVRPAEMEQGLMFRKAMGADEGMIFVYAAPQRMSFWMHNTELPLDIGYLDATGELKEIYQMYPHDERSVAARGRDLQYALEMNQGWFSQNGVKPGAKLDLKALAAALQARGFEPAKMGLRN